MKLSDVITSLRRKISDNFICPRLRITSLDWRVVLTSDKIKLYRWNDNWEIEGEYDLEDYATMDTFFTFLDSKGISYVDLIGDRVFETKYLCQIPLTAIAERTPYTIKSKYLLADAVYKEIIEEAIGICGFSRQHIETFDAQQLHLVKKAAWAQLCLELATDSAKIPEVKVGDESVDAGSRVSAYQELGERLKAELDEELVRYNARIRSSSLLRRGIDLEIIPPGQLPLPIPVRLDLLKQSDGQVWLKWTKADPRRFLCYKICYSTLPGVDERVNGEYIETIYDIDKLHYCVEGLPAGTHYFVVYVWDEAATKDNDHKAKSNELQVIV